MLARIGDQAVRHNSGKPAMRVFIANFGIANSLWPRCQQSSVVLTYDDDDPTWSMWLAGDRDGFIAFTMANKQTAKGITVPKPVAARWFNLASEVRDSEGDVWIHREKEDLWWTTTTSEAARMLQIPAPWPAPNTPLIHVVEKPTEPWSNLSRTGAPLQWSRIHPKARQFLFTEGTLQEPAPDNASYALALISGEDLSSWHGQTIWKTVVERSGHGDVRGYGSWEKAALRMALAAEGTAKASLAPPTLRPNKRKDFNFRSAHELAEYLNALLEAQSYTCALSGIALQNDSDVEETEFLASLDRIDSDGHYERDNLQIVCRFINRWKSNGDNHTFKRLLAAVRGIGGPV